MYNFYQHERLHVIKRHPYWTEIKKTILYN